MTRWRLSVVQALTPPSICLTTARRPSRITPSASKGLWFTRTFCCLNWKTYPAKAAGAGGSAAIVLKRTGSPAGSAGAVRLAGITASTGTILSATALKMLNAKHEVIIANAYFFPGYRLLHAMRSAAKRGVHVKLIVQGELICPSSKSARGCSITTCSKAGRIYEYCRPLHGKVALMDVTGRPSAQ